MDYITRRHAAASGHRGALLRGRSAHPRLSALGVRVERGGTVRRAEIAQALSDLRITIGLPPGDLIAADWIERVLSGLEPELLRCAIDAFLNSLAARPPEKPVPPTARDGSKKPSRGKKR